MTRLFLAIWPPDEVREGLADLPQPRDQGVRWVPNERRHITLRFLGDSDPDEVIDVLRRASLPTADAVLGPAFDVLGERSLVLPVGGVERLADEVRRLTRHLGRPMPRRFHGHLTVARLDRRARPVRSIGQRFEATFPVSEVALVESTLTPGGAEYETLITWPTR